MNELLKNEKIIVENLEKIDRARLVITTIITILLAIAIFKGLSNLIVNASGIAVVIPITIIVVMLGFTGVTIYGYLTKKITLTEKALVLSGGSTSKRVELINIQDITYEVVEYGGSSILKALVHEVLFGRFLVIITLKDTTQCVIPKNAFSSLIPTGFREVKAKEMVAYVKKEMEKLQ